MSGSPFWKFSLSFYGRPAAAQACLRLQEEAGADVNIVLFLLWCAARGRQLDADAVRAIDEDVRWWRGEVVQKLRGVRKAMKSPAAGWEGAEAQALRAKVKADELEAERLQQEAMYGRFDPVQIGAEAGTSAAADANLSAYAALLGVRFPDDCRAVLLSELPNATAA